MSARSLLGSSGLGAGGQTVINITNNDNAGGDSGTGSSASPLSAAAPLAIATGTISLATDPASLVLDSATGKLKVAPAVTGAVTNATTNCGLLAARVTTIESSTVPGVQATAEKARDDLAALTTTTTSLSSTVTQATGDITTLQTRLTGDETNIAANASQVANNLAAINTLAANVSTNTTNISTNTTDITTLKAAAGAGGPTLIRDTIVGDTTVRSYPPVALTSNSTVVTGQTYGNGTYTATSSSNNGAFQPYSGWTPTPNSQSQWPSAGGKYNSSGIYTGTTTTAYDGGGSAAGEWLQIGMPVSRYCTAFTTSYQSGTAASQVRQLTVLGLRGSTWYLAYATPSAITPAPTSATPNRTFTFTAPGYFSAIRVVARETFNQDYALLAGYVSATAQVVNIAGGLDVPTISLNGSTYIDTAGKLAGVDVPLLKSTSDTQGAALTSLNANYTSLSTAVGTNTTDITGLKTRATTSETNIATNTTDITTLKTRVTTTETNIATNTSDIATLKTQTDDVLLGDVTGRSYPPIAMTSNTTVVSGQTYGNGTYIASSSSNAGAYQPYQGWLPAPTASDQWPSQGPNYNPSTGAYTGAASNNNMTTTDGGAVAGEWTQLQFPTPRYCTAYTISYKSGGPGCFPKLFTIAGMRAGVWYRTFVQSTAITPAPTNTTPNATFTFTTPGYFSAIRFISQATFSADLTIVTGYVTATTQIPQAPQGIDTASLYFNGTPFVVPVVPAIPKWYKLSFTAPSSITLNSPTFVGLTYTGLGGSTAPTDATVLATPTSAWVATLPAASNGQMKYASPASFFVNYIYPTGQNVGCAVYVTYYDSALASQTFTAYAWYF